MTMIPATTPAILCWSCHSAASARDVMCPECGVILPPAALDAFACLDLPRRIGLEEPVITAGYLKAQARVHPDKVLRLSPREQFFAAQHSANINAAYQQLRDPYARALAAFAKTLADETVHDKAILQAALEQREALEEASTAAGIEEIVVTAKTTQARCLEQLQDLLDAHDTAQHPKVLLSLRYAQALERDAAQKLVRANNASK